MSRNNLVTDFGASVKSNWGTYKIGDKVFFSKEAFDNDSYEDFFDKTLIIESFDPDDDGLGVKEPIFNFTIENEGDFPFSLYGYEFSKRNYYPIWKKEQDLKKEKENFAKLVNNLAENPNNSGETEVLSAEDIEERQKALDELEKQRFQNIENEVSM